jgi:hypothetical protein
MTNFNKEELHLIEWYLKKETTVPDFPYKHLELLRKVQRMIDKYCDHEYHNTKISKHWICDICNKHCGYLVSEDFMLRVKGE